MGVPRLRPFIAVTARGLRAFSQPHSFAEATGSTRRVRPGVSEVSLWPFNIPEDEKSIAAARRLINGLVMVVMPA